MTKTGAVSGKIRFPGLSFSGLFLQVSCYVSQHCFWLAAVGDADSEDPDSQDGSSVSAGLLHHAGLRDRDRLLPSEGAERLNHVFRCLIASTLQQRHYSASDFIAARSSALSAAGGMFV
jgi:hypothetical protein